MTLPNGVLIQGCSFGGFTDYAVWVYSATSAGGVAGLRCIGNRFESGGTAFAFTGAISGDSSVPTLLMANHVLSDVTYLVNSSGVTVNSFDFSGTPAISPSMTTFGNITFRPIIGTGGNLTTVAPGNSGFSLENTSGTTLAQLIVKSVEGAALIGSSQGLTISATATPAQNLRGTIAFESSQLVQVTFPIAESDSNYFITLGASAAVGGYLWITSKSTTGFEVHCSASNSGTVDWHLIR
jgi:hypothetical protein